MYCIQTMYDEKAPPPVKGDGPCDYNEGTGFHQPDSKCPHHLSQHKQVEFNGLHRKKPVSVELISSGNSDIITHKYLVSGKTKGYVDISLADADALPTVCWRGPYSREEVDYAKKVDPSVIRPKCKSCDSGPVEPTFAGESFTGWKCKHCGDETKMNVIQEWIEKSSALLHRTKNPFVSISSSQSFDSPS